MTPFFVTVLWRLNGVSRKEANARATTQTREDTHRRQHFIKPDKEVKDVIWLMLEYDLSRNADLEAEARDIFSATTESLKKRFADKVAYADFNWGIHKGYDLDTLEYTGEDMEY